MWAVGAVVVVVEVEVRVRVVEAAGPVLGVLEGGVEGGELGVEVFAVFLLDEGVGLFGALLLVEFGDGPAVIA